MFLFGRIVNELCLLVRRICILSFLVSINNFLSHLLISNGSSSSKFAVSLKSTPTSSILSSDILQPVELIWHFSNDEGFVPRCNILVIFE